MGHYLLQKCYESDFSEDNLLFVDLNSYFPLVILKSTISLMMQQGAVRLWTY